MTTYVHHLDELEEDFRSKDLLKWDNSINDYLCNKLDKIQKSGIIGLIGPFGCGKTTFINQIIERENNINSGTKRLNFDAWKYPDRKDLRENFILDMAQNLNKKGEETVIKELKGEATSIFESILNDGGKYIDKFIPNVRHYLFSKEKRELHVIESLLREIFIALHMGENGTPHPTIYIVIEDIDRSGDAGVYFLQTLNYFLKKINLGEGLKVIAIATIGSLEYRGNLDSYLKCIDYIHTFPVPNNNYIPMLHYFLDQTCCNSSLFDFINYVGSHFEGFTPRTLKHILRDLSLIIQDLGIDNFSIQPLDDILTIIGMLTAKYINIPGEKTTYLDSFKKTGEVNEDIFKSFFLCIATHNSFIQKGNTELLNPGKFNEKIIDYYFSNFGDDNERLICIEDIPGYVNGRVHINKQLLYV